MAPGCSCILGFATVVMPFVHSTPIRRILICSKAKVVGELECCSWKESLDHQFWFRAFEGKPFFGPYPFVLPLFMVPPEYLVLVHV